HHLRDIETRRKGAMASSPASQTPLPSETFPYQGRLLAMQQRKRHADHDALLLQNRINLLRKEEAKAWKKIETAKQRSAEILRMREQNERRVVERISAAERQARNKFRAISRPSPSFFLTFDLFGTWRADDCKLQKEKNHTVEENSRQNRIRIHQELAAAKRDGVAQVRQEKQRIREDIISMRQDHFRENRGKRSDVKQKEEEARTARLEGRARLVEESRKSYEDRVRREEDEIAAREQDVARMEQKELSLIQQLKSTQAMQQMAYAELEVALSDSRAL
ncbi:unnamed protein product, partial [Laminaria digitata]